MIRAIGVGDNVVDCYLHTATMYPGGNSVNFAVYARQLGHESAYAGVLADDREGKLIYRTLEELGVDLSRCTAIAGGETGRCSTQLVDGDRVITDDNDFGSVKSSPLKITDSLLDYIRRFDVAHSSCFSFLENQLGKIKGAGVPVVYDFSDRWDMRQINDVCPNISIAFLSGKKLPDGEIKEILRRICSLGCMLAIATVGKRGAFVYDGIRFYEKLPYNVSAKVKDTLGAGDSFLTGFVTTYIDGKKLFERIATQDPGHYTTPDDRQNYFSALIEHAMGVGNLLAIKNCMVSGAFGYGKPL